MPRPRSARRDRVRRPQALLVEAAEVGIAAQPLHGAIEASPIARAGRQPSSCSILRVSATHTGRRNRRPDAPPPGLIEAGLREIGVILARLDAALAEREFLCGELSIADPALFPHLSSLKPLGIALDPQTYP